MLKLFVSRSHLFVCNKSASKLASVAFGVMIVLLIYLLNLLESMFCSNGIICSHRNQCYRWSDLIDAVFRWNRFCFFSLSPLPKFGLNRNAFDVKLKCLLETDHVIFDRFISQKRQQRLKKQISAPWHTKMRKSILFLLIDQIVGVFIWNVYPLFNAPSQRIPVERVFRRVTFA